MTNEELVQKAKDAINDVFGDMTVSVETTKENLFELISDIKIMLNALS